VAMQKCMVATQKGSGHIKIYNSYAKMYGGYTNTLFFLGCGIGGFIVIFILFFFFL
jgi:hypothetical protein